MKKQLKKKTKKVAGTKPALKTQKAIKAKRVEKIVSKKEKQQHLEEYNIIIEEILRGRNLEYAKCEAKNKDDLSVFCYGVQPAQFGIFGLNAEGKFYGAINQNFKENWGKAEGFTLEQMNNDIKSWVEVLSVDDFLEVLCKAQDPVKEIE